MDNQIKILFSYLMSKGLRREALVVRALHDDFIKSASKSDWDRPFPARPNWSTKKPYEPTFNPDYRYEPGIDESRGPFGGIEETPEAQEYESLEESQYDEAMQEAPSDLSGYEDWAAAPGEAYLPPEPPGLSDVQEIDYTEEGLEPVEVRESRPERPELLLVAEGLDYSETLNAMIKFLRSSKDPLGDVRLLHNYGLENERLAVLEMFGAVSGADDKLANAARNFIDKYGLMDELSLDEEDEEELIKELDELGYDDAKDRVRKYLKEEPVVSYVMPLLEKAYEYGLFKQKDGRRRRDWKTIVRPFGFIETEW